MRWAMGLAADAATGLAALAGPAWVELVAEHQAWWYCGGVIGSFLVLEALAQLALPTATSRGWVRLIPLRGREVLVPFYVLLAGGGFSTGYILDVAGVPRASALDVSALMLTFYVIRFWTLPSLIEESWLEELPVATALAAREAGGLSGTAGADPGGRSAPPSIGAGAAGGACDRAGHGGVAA
jgi:hypothetical protein